MPARPTFHNDMSQWGLTKKECRTLKRRRLLPALLVVAWLGLGGGLGSLAGKLGEVADTGKTA